MREPIPVVVAVITQQQQVLVAQRTHGRFAGLWELPGGKIEPGELPEAALVRELQEELNIHITTFELNFQYLYDYGDYAVALQVFHVSAFEGEVQGAEGQCIDWVSFEQFQQLQMLEATKRLYGVVAQCLNRE